MPRIDLLSTRNVIFLDQALLSGLNFFTAIILTRVLGIEDFGTYAMVFVGLLLINTLHYSVFAAPMMTFGPQIDGESKRNEYYSNTHSAQLIMSVLLSIFLYMAGSLILHFTHNFDYLDYLLPFSLCVLAVPPLEWMRRYFFSKSQPQSALKLDFIRTVLQLGVILLLSALQKLNIQLVLYTIALASLVAYLSGLFFCTLRAKHTNPYEAIVQNWKHGRHLLPASLIDWARLQGFLIIGGILLGASSAGAVRAAQNIVGPLNVLYQAMDNILPVEGARRLVKYGRNNMISYFRSISIKSLSGLVLVCIIIALISQWLMGLLYGKPFEAYYTLVIWQLLSLIVLFAFRIGASYLRTVNASKSIMTCTAISFIVLSFLIIPFSYYWKEDGLMLAKVIAEITALILLGYGILKQYNSAQVANKEI